MKKLIALIVMMTYMASAFGFSYSLHYCGGHFKKVCFTSDTEKGCCGNGKHKKNCCDDKVVTAKFKDNHTTFAKAVLSKVFFEHSAIHCPFISSGNYVVEGYRTSISNDPSPPGSSNFPLYLLNRVIRI